MKNSIIYIILYFGKLPNNFELYLESCAFNKDVEWLMFTDDITEYKYPPNFKVIYTSFESITNKIKGNFEFDICLEYPYKLCTYKPAYGQIFKDYIKNYDFWGYCDIDMLWGDIRKFYSDDVLENYDKIGWQGHSTLYRNNEEINGRYLLSVNGIELFKKEAQIEQVNCFDEGGMDEIYNSNGWSYYKKVDFAHPSAEEYNFKLKHLPKQEEYKNKYQVFTWEHGHVFRLYSFNDKVYKEEFMYIHFFRRLMDIQIKDRSGKYLILPHKIINMPESVTSEYIINNSKNSKIKYYLRLLQDKKKLGKFSFKYIIPSVKARIKKE